MSFGLGYNDKIGIFSNNRIDWTISDLSVFAIWGVVVPLYATASKQEIKYIVDETEMKLLFIDGELQLEKAIWILSNTNSIKKVIVNSRK